MFLLSYWAVNRSLEEGAEALQMTLHTLRMMALGGVHDHVAQVHTHTQFQITTRHSHRDTHFVYPESETHVLDHREKYD